MEMLKVKKVVESIVYIKFNRLTEGLKVFSDGVKLPAGFAGCYILVACVISLLAVWEQQFRLQALLFKKGSFYRVLETFRHFNSESLLTSDSHGQKQVCDTQIKYK